MAGLQYAISCWRGVFATCTSRSTQSVGAFPSKHSRKEPDLRRILTEGLRSLHFLFFVPLRLCGYDLTFFATSILEYRVSNTEYLSAGAGSSRSTPERSLIRATSRPPVRCSKPCVPCPCVRLPCVLQGQGFRVAERSPLSDHSCKVNLIFHLSFHSKSR